MTDEEKSEISFVVCTNYSILLHFALHCWKISFFFVDLRCFVADVEKKLAKNSAREEKMTSIRYGGDSTRPRKDNHKDKYKCKDNDTDEET